MRGKKVRSLMAAAALAAADLVGLSGGPARAATTINVPAAKPTIQAAIEAAVAGDTVVVAPGTYHERIDFKGKAIEVKSSAGPATTIIDGDATGITVVFHTQETRASVLRGFTITDGLQPPMQQQLVGGGIAVKDASPTIVGNVVTANAGSGIGVVLGSPLIQDNVITANNTPYDGGGIWAGRNSEIVGNRIEGNTADDAAGLVIFGSTVVRNNVIRGNTASGQTFGGGGGLIAYGGVVVNNLIADNTALVGPSAKGGGVLWIANDPPQLHHNTFVGNTSPIGSAIAGLSGGTVSGNVVVGPAGTSVVHCSGDPTTFSFNDVFNGTTSRYACGNGFDFTGFFGNISADPQFVSSTDRHLQAGSPAIDAGDPAASSPPASDLAGAPRIIDGNGDGLAVIDMGAYEAPTPAQPPANHRVNDFDGNGTTDVAVFRPATGTWYLRTASPTAVAWGQSGDVPVPGDYNGDGATDIAVFRPSNNAWYIRTPTPQFVLWGEAGDISVPADYDGNGTTDIAIFRPSTGTWYLRTASPSAVVWGQAGDIPVPGDYDGNGSVDVAVFRPSNNAWYLRTTTPQFVLWGEAGDIPVPGDYDNNGTTDIAILRPATGTWYLRTGSPSAVVWGQAGDIPVPGDYDGNGSTDIAVFRPANSSWYIRTPTPQFVLWGEAGDKALSLAHTTIL